MAGSSDQASGEGAASATPEADNASGTTTSGSASGATTTEKTEADGGTVGGSKGRLGRKKAAAAEAEKAPAKDKKDSKGKAAIKAAPALIRTRVAQAVWLLCLVAALFLALGALIIALDFNQQNAAVEFVLSGAERVDLGIFTRQGGIKEFTGENAATKNALVNYGAGALVWLIAGRIADRFIRP